MRLLRTIGGIDFTGQERAALNKLTMPMSRRLEAPHLALPLPRRLMGHRRTVVRRRLCAVHHGPVRRGVTAELVGDQPAGETTLFLQPFPKEPDGGTPMPPRLDQDVEPDAVCIDGSPPGLPSPGDGDAQLVEGPDVAEPTPAMPEPSRVGASKRPAPLANCLVGDDDAALGEHVFDIPDTQAAPQVEPDGVRHDLARESISVIARRGTVHPVTLTPWTSTRL